ncbi:hypothetical protein DZC31_30105 (plasmid) [Stenotrophomonas rhizophila]|nr:hypothetical protein DZC31_30105 [Stenotrophomonas rhizophila]
MRIREIAFLMMLMPVMACAADAAPADPTADTFSKLLNKQAELLEAEMDMKIRQVTQSNAPGPAGVTPLPGVKQEVNEAEPVVEAIWGLAGKEVAEINYKGRHIPVSKQEPFISKIDGWKLESIEQYRIVLVRMLGKRVVQRKTVMLDWQGSEASQPTTPGASYVPQPAVITPPIISPAIR